MFKRFIYSIILLLLIFKTSILFASDSSFMSYGSLTNLDTRSVISGATGVEKYNPTDAYLVNDLVAYQGNIYRCIQAHTPPPNHLPTDPLYWTQLTLGVAAITFYDIATTYNADDMVKYNDKVYVSLQGSNTANQPDISLDYWRPYESEYYYVACDGTQASAAENRLAINVGVTAMNARGGGTVVIVGLCYVDLPASSFDPIIQAQSGVNIVGINPSESIIKIKDGVGNYRAIIGSSLLTTNTNIIVENLTFDHNASNNPLATLAEYAFPGYSRSTWRFIRGEDVVFRNNIVQDSSSQANVVFLEEDATSSENYRIRITGNTFTGIGELPVVGELDHSTIHVQGDDVIIRDNIFQGDSWGATMEGATTAIETHGSNYIISSNTISQYRRAMNITGASFTTDDNEKQLVVNNIMNVTRLGIVIWSNTGGSHLTGYGIRNLVLDDNYIMVEYTRNTSATNLYNGISIAQSVDLPMENIQIVNNTVEFDQESIAFANISAFSSGIHFYCPTTQDLDIDKLLIRENVIKNAPLTGINFEYCNFINPLIESNIIENAGQNLEGTISNNFRRAIALATRSIDGKLVIKNNQIIDSFATARLKYGYFLSGGRLLADSRDVELIDNTIRFLGTSTGYIEDINFIAATYKYIPYIDTQIKSVTAKNVPNDDCLIGSRIYDPDNQERYYLAAEGTTWLNYIMPANLGSTGNALLTDGSGVLSWGTPTSSPQSYIQDTDADTKVTTENAADEDIIRFFTGAGGQQFYIQDGVILPVLDADINFGNATTRFNGLYLRNHIFMYGASTYGLIEYEDVSGVNGFAIAPQTTDGSDNRQVSICGGGICEPERGAEFVVHGNESTGSGSITLDTGDNATADINMSASDRFLFNTNSNDRLQIESDGTLSSLVTNYETLVLADNDIPNKKYVDDEIGDMVFGSEFQQAVSASESSTTSATFQQKLRLTTGTVPAGTYRIGVTFNYSSDDENEEMEFQLELDDTTQIWYADPVQKKKLSDGVYMSAGAFTYTVLTNAVHTFDLDYANSNSKTTYIKNARIEIWRVQ